MSDAILQGLYIGTPRDLEAEKGRWKSAFGRHPVEGRLPVAPDGVPGDAVFNTKAHGGPDRMLLAYAAAHYDRWRAEHPGHAFDAPAFGENLLVAGLDEETVRVGDVWLVGTARLQVTQPRFPCQKISMFNHLPGLLDEVMATGREGWLLRVLEAGDLGAGDAIKLVARPYPAWTVARVFRHLVALRAGDPAAAADAAELGGLDALAASWRDAVDHAVAALA